MRHHPPFKLKLVVTVFLTFDLVAAVHADTSYTVINLGPMYGRTSTGFAINELGNVTGYMEPSSVAYGYGEAFLYTPSLTLNLGTLGGHSSYGLGINDLNQVVGFSYLEGEPGKLEPVHAFLYSNNVMTDLGTLGGFSSAYDINNNGIVVGASQIADGITHSFMYSGGVMSDLGTFGWTTSAAGSINDNGQILGVYSQKLDNGLTSGGSFLYGGGGVTDLGNVSGEALNNLGDVVGTYLSESGAQHAFLYTGGAMIDLGALSNGMSMAKGINDLGDVVGFATVGSGSGYGTEHAFLRSTSDGVMMDLNDFIDPASGWTLSIAIDINNAGMITGYGSFNGVQNAFLLTPDYQIKPYPNEQGSLITVDDAAHGWYNAVNFVNDGVIKIDPNALLTNRTGARIDNNGVIENDAGHLVFDGNYSTGPSGSLLNLDGVIDVNGVAVDFGTFVNGIGNVHIGSAGRYSYLGTGDGRQFLNTGTIINDGEFVIGAQARLEGNGAVDNNGNLLLANNALVSGATIHNDGNITLNSGATMLAYLDNESSGVVTLNNLSHFYGDVYNAGSVILGGAEMATLPWRADNAPVRIDNAYRIVLKNNASLEITAGGFFNNENMDSYVDVRSGSVFGETAGSSLVNHGAILVGGGRLLLDGQFSNYGQVMVSDDANLGLGYFRVGGESQNHDSISIMNSFMEIAQGGHLSGSGSVYADSGSTIRVNGVLDGNHIDCFSCRIEGRGTLGADLALVMQGSILAPGNSPGTLTVLGSLDMDASSTIELQIASPDDYDHLITGGSASFANTQVAVSFLDGYLPDEPESFAWFTANGGWSGYFNYDLPTDWWYSTTESSAGAALDLYYANTYELTTPPDGENLVLQANALGYITEYNELDNYNVFDNSGVLHVRENATLWNGGGQINNNDGAWIVNRGQFHLSYAGGPLSNAGTVYNHASGTLINQSLLEITTADSRLINRGQLENDSLIVNHGLVQNSGVLENYGSIENHADFIVDSSGIVTGSGNYYQDTGTTRVDGQMSLSSGMDFVGGTLTGLGVLSGDVNLGYSLAGPSVQPGDGIGTLSIDGNLSAENVVFDIEVAGATNYDRLAVSGMTNVYGGEVDFVFTGGYKPTAGDSIQWLFSDNGSFGMESLLYALWNVDMNGIRTVWQLPSDLSLTFTGDRLEFAAVQTSSVPLSGSWIMFLSGLGLMGRIVRQRERTVFRH